MLFPCQPLLWSLCFVLIVFLNWPTWMKQNKKGVHPKPAV
jgi:hypothetical protein